MLIPSIDLMGGKIVQLVQGKDKLLEFDDFEPWVERFRDYPLIQLIDLDAAMNKGDQRELIAQLACRLPCQVGGGVRGAKDAEQLFQAGAQRVILGSALFRENAVDEDFARNLSENLPSERLTFAVDAKNGRVAVRGWRATLNLAPSDAMRALEAYCGAFLYTHIDTEGLMCGIPFEIVSQLRATTARRLFCAGGIKSWDEIHRLDAAGVDAVVGMAIYNLSLAV